MPKKNRKIEIVSDALPEDKQKRGELIKFGKEVAEEITKKVDESLVLSGALAKGLFDIARYLVESDKVSLIGVQKVNDMLVKINENLTSLETLKDSDSRERVILEISGFVKEVESMLMVLRVEENIEVVEGKDGDVEVYNEGDGVSLNLTIMDTLLETVKKQLSSVKTGDKGDKDYYLNLEKERSIKKPKEFLRQAVRGKEVDKVLQLVTNIHSESDIVVGKKIVFNFGENEDLEFMTDVSILPPKVRSVLFGGVQYVRNGVGGFFNVDGRALTVFDGTVLSVVSVGSEFGNEEAYKKNFGNKYSENDALVSYAGKVGKVEKQEVLAVGKKFGVDAFLLEAILNVRKGDLSTGVTDAYEFLYLSARNIQNSRVLYERNKGNAIEGSCYKVDFVVYMLDRFNIFNLYIGRSSDAKKIVKLYSQLKDVDLAFDREVEVRRDSDRPKATQEVADLKRRGIDYKREVFYRDEDILKARPGMSAEMKENLFSLRRSLEEDPLFPKSAMEMAMVNAEKIYKAMVVRAGMSYRGKVVIQKKRMKSDGSVEIGKDWKITNSCVGHLMKVAENTDFYELKGRQKGKHSSNHVWSGGRDPFFSSLVSSPDDVLRVKNIDVATIESRVGALLKNGEPAMAALWDHVFWVYKRPDGSVWMSHSGADVRPKQVSVLKVSEAPPGYRLNRAGTYYVKESGSKVNNVPLSYFIQKRGSLYTGQDKRSKGLDYIKILPLRTLVKANIQNLV